MSPDGKTYSEFDPGEIAPRLRAVKEHGVGSGRKVAGIQCNRRHGRRISNSERSSFLLSGVGLCCAFYAGGN